MIAVIWHFWIAVFLFVPVLILMIATVAGYVNKVHKPRYPGADQERA